MANKQFTLSNGQVVDIYKHRASRSLRITLRSDGTVRITIPSWTPYITGVQFAEARREWIAQHLVAKQLLVNGQAVGRAHHLRFEAVAKVDKPKSKIKDVSILVSYPQYMSETDAAVQTVAEKACIKALRLQAESLLPQRLQYQANTHGFSYSGSTIKQLKGRWGSCDHNKHIVLNLFLMQLPWELIDYVLLHELTHTVVMKHGPEFWSELKRVCPNVSSYRKQIKAYQPRLSRGDEAATMA